MKRVLMTAAFAVAMASANGAAAQGKLSTEELEKLVQEQRAALEEAIANREETKARAAAVQEALNESEERKRTVEQELKELCEEREKVQQGSLEECMSTLDS